jgi:hypothetical protein
MHDGLMLYREEKKLALPEFRQQNKPRNPVALAAWEISDYTKLKSPTK